uniref:Transposase n=1 Tax=Ascaris lumbricoides TaxID=6252 RepID=A0A0M3IMH8_ASCLU
MAKHETRPTEWNRVLYPTIEIDGKLGNSSVEFLKLLIQEKTPNIAMAKHETRLNEWNRVLYPTIETDGKLGNSSVGNH